MKFPLCLTYRKQTASFRMAGSMLAIAPLWLMLAAANTSAYAQTSNTAAATSTPAPSPADWTEFHRDNMQRWNPYETVLGVNNVASLQLMWQSGCCDSDFGLPGLPPPAVANGVVYVSSDHGTVYALNASTGATLWSNTTVGLSFGSPAVANGVVYVDDGNLYALNASTGAKLWSYTTGGQLPGGQPLSSPAVANGVVYFGSDDGNVYALNASTGAKLWSFTTAYPVESSPAVANGVVYIGSDDDNLYALNASTGAKLWSFATGGEATVLLLSLNRLVFLMHRAKYFPRPPWRMGWCMSARTTATCMR
jgi:outer membrane protein assembly factor BamB